MHLAHLHLAAVVTAWALITGVLIAVALRSGLRAVRRAISIFGVLFLTGGLALGSAVFLTGGAVLLVIAWWWVR